MSPGLIRQPIFPLTGPFTVCPPIGKLSSTFTRRFFFYVHEHLLKPVSRLYCRYWAARIDPVIYPLPFGFLLKERPRLREQEGLAMNLARAMGVPAPRFISFGEPPPNSRGYTSILMTAIPGQPLDEVDQDIIDMDIICEDLRNILAQMRRFINPRGDTICGVDGGPVRGHFIPASPMPPHDNERQFHAFIRSVAALHWNNPAYQKAKRKAEEFFALPPHAIVFTHGDFNKHNIMIGADGRVSGIVDWENGAWLPEYWEFAVTASMAARPWGKIMDKVISGGVYSESIICCRAVYALTADSFAY